MHPEILILLSLPMLFAIASKFYDKSSQLIMHCPLSADFTETTAQLQLIDRLDIWYWNSCCLFNWDKKCFLHKPLSWNLLITNIWCRFIGIVSIYLQEWLDVWGLLVGEAKKINDLPMWLQYYPKTLFDTINRSGSGVISKQELRWI